MENKETKTSRKVVIGIDLGTTTSSVAVVPHGTKTPNIIPNNEGHNTTPSIVSYGKDGERKIGEPAKRQAITNSKNTVYEIKRFMGCSSDQVNGEVDRVAYKVISKDNKPMVELDIAGEKRDYTPQEISAAILQKMKKTAEDYLGHEVKEAVITVPAYFNDAQRQATKEAGAIAGLDVLRIVNEPTAAALAYGLDKLDKDLKVLVFDFGGGTHDVSLLSCADGIFEVLATDGDTKLGGSDCDEQIMNWIIETFKSESGIDVKQDPMALQRVKEAAEKAKIELSSSSSTDINLPYLSAGTNGPKHFNASLSRAKFEQMISGIVEKTLVPCQRVLENAGVSSNEIDEIILVGGSTRIPAIQEAVAKFFGKQPAKNVNPDEVVAMGAAVQGAILAGNDQLDDVVLLDCTALNIGIETLGGVMTTMIESNTTYPVEKSDVFSTAQDNQDAVTINIFQGNRGLVKDNKHLGQFNLTGIAPAPKGVPQIEVTLSIDANGMLKVEAKDKATGKSQAITIESSNLSEDEIARMKAEAEANAEADKKEVEKLQQINMLQDMGYSIRRNMDEDNFKEKITEEQRTQINEKIDELLKATDEKDLDKAQEIQKALMEIWGPIAQEVYKAQAEAQHAAQTTQEDSVSETVNESSSTENKDNVEDVAFEEVK